MDKIVLELLVNQGLSQREIACQLNVSHGCIRHQLKKHNLKTHKNKNIVCRICGEQDLNKFYVYKDGRIRYRCRKCDNESTINRFRKYKQDAVAYKGGKCEKCGYDKCAAAFDFHHNDPHKKDPNWQRMRSWPIEKIKTELDKCMLVCATCHREIHYEID